MGNSIERRVRAIAMLMVLTLAVVGCGSDAPTIIGEWNDRNDFLWEFDSEGEFAVQGGSVEVGTYRFDGDILELDDAEDSSFCAGVHAEYEVTFLDGGDLMELELIDDPCEIRRDADFGPLRRQDS